MNIPEGILCSKTHEWILDNGDGTFTIAVLAYDDTPERHELTFEWTGPIEAEDYSYMFNAPPAPITPLKVYAR